jgi:glycosyltransferase involved in cell wall biosynthesis
MIESSKPLISICIPVLNEDGNIRALYNRLHDVTSQISSKYQFEFIFSDNNSSDETWSLITELSKSDKRVKAIRFTKNIGFQESILANLNQARGVAMIQIDADLQDPPELIVEFISSWEEGFKVVYGVRITREESKTLNWFRKIGYKIVAFLSETPIPSDVGDFRLIDAEVVRLLLTTQTPKPYLRGMISSFSLPSHGINYSRNARRSNVSKFPVRKIMGLGLDGIFNHSTWPLRFATYSGISILVISLFLSIYYIGMRLYSNNLLPGLASIHILVVFGIGMNALFLGIIGDYLSRIYLILKKEPRYIIRESLNLEDHQ